MTGTPSSRQAAMVGSAERRYMREKLIWLLARRMPRAARKSCTRLVIVGP